MIPARSKIANTNRLSLSTLHANFSLTKNLCRLGFIHSVDFTFVVITAISLSFRVVFWPSESDITPSIYRNKPVTVSSTPMIFTLNAVFHLYAHACLITTVDYVYLDDNYFLNICKVYWHSAHLLLETTPGPSSFIHLVLCKFCFDRVTSSPFTFLPQDNIFILYLTSIFIHIFNKFIQNHRFKYSNKPAEPFVLLTSRCTGPCSTLHFAKRNSWLASIMDFDILHSLAFISAKRNGQLVSIMDFDILCSPAFSFAAKRNGQLVSIMDLTFCTHFPSFLQKELSAGINHGFWHSVLTCLPVLLFCKKKWPVGINHGFWHSTLTFLLPCISCKKKMVSWYQSWILAFWTHLLSSLALLQKEMV